MIAALERRLVVGKLPLKYLSNDDISAQANKKMATNGKISTNNGIFWGLVDKNKTNVDVTKARYRYFFDFIIKPLFIVS